MSDTDGQSGAEALDDAQLGADEAILGDEPSLDYPPERPLGVDEAQTVDDAIEDSVEERLAREEPDIGSIPEDAEQPVLAEDWDGDAMTADAYEAGPDDLAAEESALHVEEESPEDEEGSPPPEP
jgi:hypothetical protein